MSSAPPVAPAVVLANLTVAYRGHPAVHHLSVEFATGSLTAIVGPNGAGKTSLLDAILGRIQPVGGEVRIAADLQRRLAFLPQQVEIDRSFPLRVFDFVALGHWGRVGAFRGLDRAATEAVSDSLGAVGLAGFERRNIGELSTGQFQRVLFARVLLQDAHLILLDEPFNAVDARTTADLLAVIHRWHAERRTVIAVLHDIEQVREHFDRALLLARRCIAYGPSVEVLSADNLRRARLQAEAWDEAAPACVEAA